MPLVEKCHSWKSATRAKMPLVEKCHSWKSATRAKMPLVEKTIFKCLLSQYCFEDIMTGVELHKNIIETLKVVIPLPKLSVLETL